MCGILGASRIDRKTLKQALEGFKYRGPDFTGQFIDENICLGHHRLSIIDLDERANQPFASGQNIIIYNGEIYNFKELKKNKLKDFKYHTESDTEVILKAYEKWGKDCFKYLKGMYALAIYDQKAQKIILARDQVGIKPLYYFAKDDLFIFASEIKGILAILKAKGIKSGINKTALDLYLSLGYIPSPLSLYQNIHKVPPGSFLEYGLNEKKILEAQPVLIKSQMVQTEEEYFQLIEKKILNHLVSDVPVGVFFSGGTDSSLIAAVLNKYKINLETFSIQMSHKEQDEKFYKAISEKLNIKANVYNFGLTEFNSIYADVMGKIDEPVSDTSLFPTYYISKMAKGKVKVVLSGEGGDEFFYGYLRQKFLHSVASAGDYELDIMDQIYLALPRFRGKNRIFAEIFRLFKKPMSYYILKTMKFEHKAGYREWKKIFNESQVRPLDLDKKYYLENDLLRKTDWATSYNSIEGRVPLLDIDIINNSKNFQDQMIASDETMKALLKKMLLKFLPPELVYRDKSGFGMNPYEIFTKNTEAKKEIDQVFKYFNENDTLGFKLKSKGYYLKRFPDFLFSLLFLYHTLINNEQA